MISVKIETKELDDLVKRMQKDLGPQGMKKFFLKTSIVMYKDVLTHFEREEGPDGKWERWKGGRSTRPTKRGGSKMLQDTGRLRLSIQPSHSSESAVVGTNIEYAAIQNYGSSKKDHPAREFMWISDECVQKIQDMASTLLEEGADAV